MRPFRAYMASGRGAGGAGGGSAITLSPTDKDVSIVLSNGNLTATKLGSGSVHCLVRATSAFAAGKWYWEVRVDGGMNNSFQAGGITKSTVAANTDPGASADGWVYEGVNGRLYHAASGALFGSSYTNGDVIGAAFDTATGKLWFAKNNVWQASGSPATGANPAATVTAGSWFITVGMYDLNDAVTMRFSAADQSYAAPSGFSPVN